jgi:plastocyanin
MHSAAMTTYRFLRVLVSGVALLALAACGGGGPEANDDAAGGDSAAGAESVTIKDSTFSPGDIAVAAGSTVTWTSNDSVPHTVTFDDDAATDSDELNEGDTHSVTFDKAGEYSYVCAIHPDMKAKVTVS